MADEIPRFAAEAASENRRLHKDRGPWKDPDFAGDFDWEVTDRTRVASRRVICRTNRADAMMIVEALNETTRDTLTNDKGETLTETMNRVRALPK